MRLTYHVETFRYAYPALSHYTTPLPLILVSLNRLAKLRRFLLKLQNVHRSASDFQPQDPSPVDRSR
jgi:hypothetical protein